MRNRPSGRSDSERYGDMFKDELRQVAEERGLKNKDLAEQLGIAPASVSYYLSGRVTPPEKKKQQLAVSLGLDADYFTPNAASVEESVTADGGYRMKPKIAAALMGISLNDLYDLLEDGVYTFGRVWTNRGSTRRTCWISRILFTQETGIPVSKGGA